MTQRKNADRRSGGNPPPGDYAAAEEFSLAAYETAASEARRFGIERAAFDRLVTANAANLPVSAGWPWGPQVRRLQTANAVIAKWRLAYGGPQVTGLDRFVAWVRL
jgi:hypothetical protein